VVGPDPIEHIAQKPDGLGGIRALVLHRAPRVSAGHGIGHLRARRGPRYPQECCASKAIQGIGEAFKEAGKSFSETFKNSDTNGR
jgi:hypothetical protein